MQLTGTNAMDCRLALVEFEPSTAGSGLKMDDFILGKFDVECLGEHPPETDWSDWFPPPKRMTDWELYDLTDWVELEAEKCDSVQDTFYFQLSGKEHYET